MTFIVDASVAVKWVLAETGSARADEIWDNAESIIAPDLIVVEIGNTLWKRSIRGEIHVAMAFDALKTVSGLFTTLVPIKDLSVRALEIAMTFRHPIYDCIYLALSERERVPLITADKRLLDVAKQMKGVDVRALSLA